VQRFRKGAVVQRFSGDSAEIQHRRISRDSEVIQQRGSAEVQQRGSSEKFSREVQHRASSS